MNDLKQFAKNEMNWKPYTGNEDIQSRYEYGNKCRKMSHANNEKWETIHDVNNDQIRTNREIETYKYLEIFEVDTIIHN